MALGVRVFQATLAWRMFNCNRLLSRKLRLHALKRLFAAANRLYSEAPIILANRQWRLRLLRTNKTQDALCH